MTPTPQRHTLKLEDGTLTYLLERKLRKTISLRITADGLLVSAPARLPLSQLEDSLRSKLGWIERKLRQVTLPTLLPHQVLYLGRILEPISVSGLEQARLVGEGLELLDGDPQALERWYRAQAKIYLTAKVREWSAQRFKPARVSITGARGRWGSCSSDGRLNFSWRILRLSPDLIDYVVVHELCHLEHMDHSKRFWDALESVMPDYRTRHEAIKSLPIV